MKPEIVYTNILGRAMRCEVIHRIVRLRNSPIPLIGLVVGEDVTMSEMPAWIVQIYGYSLKTEAWLKSECSVPTTDIPGYIDIAGWKNLARQHEGPA